MQTQVQLLESLMGQCKARLQHYSCLGVANSTVPMKWDLQNAVHPIFAPDRWLRGFEQQTSLFYNRMEPALRLASLFLQEDCVLDHFTHFKFGLRKRNAFGIAYIGQQTIPYSSAAKADIKKDFHKLAKVITCLFCPRSYHDQIEFYKGKPVYGRTYLGKKWTPFYHHYHSKDWPIIDPMHQDCAKPIILLNSGFVDYLGSPDFHNTSLPRWYRSQVDEVCWSNKDVKAELGFAWEMAVLGCILNPLSSDIRGCPLLVSAAFRSYLGEDSQADAIKQVVGRNDLYWKKLYSDGDNAPWEQLLQPQNIRGGVHTCRTDLNCVGAIRAIPMEWIVDWFRESTWERRRRDWARYGIYEPPTVGKTFLLLYKYDDEGANVYYPLDPTFRDDEQDIREQQQWAQDQRGGPNYGDNYGHGSSRCCRNM